MKMSRGDDNEIDLMMVCVDEELLPWQHEAHVKAEKAYMDVCKEIADAKRRLIENQVQQRLLIGGANDVIQPASAVVPNQTTQVPISKSYCQMSAF